MHDLKIVFSFFVVLILPEYQASQTLTGIKTGINWTNFRDVQNKKTLYGAPMRGLSIQKVVGSNENANENQK
jgi:hypothetical protein